MALWLEKKYISLLSNRLKRFKWTSDTTANFRCPICKDSKKSESKCRGWIFLSKTKKNYVFKCHNCGLSMGFEVFLKDIDHNLYSEMIFEKIQEEAPAESSSGISSEPDLPPEPKQDYLAGLTKLTRLFTTHPCKQYIESRKIPKEKHGLFYYTDDFWGYVDTALEIEKYRERGKEERLVIPFYRKDGSVFAIQGRVLPGNKSNLRYATVKFDEQADKIYGQERLDHSKPYYVVEGPIDSIFLSNAIAMAGSDTSAGFLDKKHAIMLYDNEPYNKEIVNKMIKVIEDGFRIVIWPDEITSKDINQLILDDVLTEPLEEFLEANTYRGLSASLRMTVWKKC